MEGIRGRGPALSALCVVAFLTFLDTTIVAVALAAIQTGLHVGVAGLQWVVDGYALTFAALMLAGGTLGDRFGRRRLMVAGLGLFGAASILGAVTPDIQLLILARVLMGVGAAASEPGTLSVLRHVFPEARARARAVGVWVAVAGLALAMGPVVGGALVGLGGWRAIFYFNIGFAVLGMVFALRVVPESADPQPGRLDLPGLGTAAAALIAGTFAVILGETHGYSTWWIDLLFAVAAAAAVAFVLIEQHSSFPAVAPRLFRDSLFGAANLTAFAVYFSVLALFFFVALYLQLVGTSNGYDIAFDFIPMAAGLILASAFTGRLVAWVGVRLPTVLGCALAAAGLILTDEVLKPNSGLSTVGWTMALAGIGFGMAVVPATAAALSAVPAERSGMAASITNTSRQLGAVVGVAVLGALVDAGVTSGLESRLRKITVIPKSYYSIIQNAVLTGQAPKSAHGGGLVSRVTNEVIAAAQQSFGTGLNLALSLAAGLLAATGLIALLGLRGEPSTRDDLGPTFHEWTLFGSIHRRGWADGRVPGASTSSWGRSSR
jgi:EmrB/QacA subfamily drug resistance transporter